MSAEAISDPVILDVVELPLSVQLCGCWRESDGKMVPCDEMATHVFVYDRKVGDGTTVPRNCLACPDCAPRAADHSSEGDA